MRIVTEIVREETYCFTPNNGEPPVNIRSGRLREMLLDLAMDKVIELTFPDETEQQLIDRHGLEQSRMDSMTLLEAADPVIVGFWPGDGTHILIDGAHRRWFWHKRGVHKLRGWALPYEVWAQFIFDPNGPNTIAHRASGEMLPQRRKK
jgi:hypothetical protein